MAHLDAAYRCNMCGEIPEMGPMYHCPKMHRYCLECFGSMQKRYYRDNALCCACCVVCKYSGEFEIAEVNKNVLQKLRVRPGIGRPCRYNVSGKTLEEKPNNNIGETATNQEQHVYSCCKSHGDGLSTSGIDHCSTGTAKKPLLVDSFSSMTISKRPLTCPHDGCHKSVAVSCLVSHYKHEHGNIPRFVIERGKPTGFLIDMYAVENIRTVCMFMVTVYEFNRIQVKRSQSSQSIINTCTKLSGKVPINTFWLMASGNLDRRKPSSYILFWLYTNSDDKYWCTVQLNSLDGKRGVSGVCRTVGLHEGCDVTHVTDNLNCLFVTQGTFLALMADGERVNLRVLLH